MTATSELVDGDSGKTKKDLQRTIDSLNARKYDINLKMRTIGRKLRLGDGIDSVLLDQYQRLNDKLRETKIYEAELVHTKNML
jgi:hypothetical protein